MEGVVDRWSDVRPTVKLAVLQQFARTARPTTTCDSTHSATLTANRATSLTVPQGPVSDVPTTATPAK